MNIYPVTQNNFSGAIELLKKNDLPTEDITDTTKLFVIHEQNEVTGVVGLQTFGDKGLLRSLCVSDRKRKNGLGKELVSFAETYAAGQGVKHLFLLTIDAADFFKKRAYEIIDRNEVPETIQQTAEFSKLCPSSAVAMKKSIT